MFEIAKNEDVNVEMVLQDDDNINLNYGNKKNLVINVMINNILFYYISPIITFKFYRFVSKKKKKQSFIGLNVDI